MAYERIGDYITEEGSRFSGDTDLCTFMYNVKKPDQFMTQSEVDELVNKSVNEVIAKNGVPLRVTVYEDKSGILDTAFQVSIIAYDRSNYEGIDGIGMGPWVFLAWALVVAAITAIIWMVYTGLMAFSKISWQGVANAASSVMWLILIGAGVLIFGGLLSGTMRKRYEAGEQWVKESPKRWKGSGGKISSSVPPASAPRPSHSGRHMLDTE